jgi:hypothetical protein
VAAEEIAVGVLRAYRFSATLHRVVTSSALHLRKRECHRVPGCHVRELHAVGP